MHKIIVAGRAKRYMYYSILCVHTCRYYTMCINYVVRGMQVIAAKQSYIHMYNYHRLLRLRR